MTPPDFADALPGFHPVVRRWFRESFDAPTPGERVPTVFSHGIGFRDRVPVSVLEGDDLRTLGSSGSGEPDAPDHEAWKTLVRREIPPALRSYVRGHRARKSASIYERVYVYLRARLSTR